MTSGNEPPRSAPSDWKLVSFLHRMRVATCKCWGRRQR